MRFILAYFRMRIDGAGHLGSKQYASNQVRIARKLRIETRGRL